MKTKSSVGVVIGRFQVPELHNGHHHIIRYARDRHDHLLILVGSREGFPTPRSPLSFIMRRTMLLSKYPSATVVEIFDHPSDHEWSTRLDNIVKALFPDMSATLYGSRDSFIPYYHGVHETKEVPTMESESGSNVRSRIKDEIIHSSDFRRGVIHSHMVRVGIPYPTVDVAVLKRESNLVLLGQKQKDGSLYRFPGGFYDPILDTSLEEAAKRELGEETGCIEVGNLSYIGSHKVDDWRYRGGPDCVITTLFKADYIFGAPCAQDDLSHLEWFSLERLPEILIPEHKPLGEMFLNSVKIERRSSI